MPDADYILQSQGRPAVACSDKKSALSMCRAEAANGRYAHVWALPRVVMVPTAPEIGKPWIAMMAGPGFAIEGEEPTDAPA